MALKQLAAITMYGEKANKFMTIIIMVPPAAKGEVSWHGRKRSLPAKEKKGNSCRHMKKGIKTLMRDIAAHALRCYYLHIVDGRHGKTGEKEV